jgi:hypothetical protein
MGIAIGHFKPVPRDQLPLVAARAIAISGAASQRDFP